MAIAPAMSKKSCARIGKVSCQSVSADARGTINNAPIRPNASINKATRHKICSVTRIRVAVAVITEHLPSVPTQMSPQLSNRLGDDLIGALGPDERLRVDVPMLDELLVVTDERLDARTGCSSHRASGQDREPGLHHVHPRRTGRREVELNVRRATRTREARRRTHEPPPTPALCELEPRPPSPQHPNQMLTSSARGRRRRAATKRSSRLALASKTRSPPYSPDRKSVVPTTIRC